MLCLRVGGCPAYLRAPAQRRRYACRHASPGTRSGSLCSFFGAPPTPRAYAQESHDITGVTYYLPDDNRYEFWTTTDQEITVPGQNAMAGLSIAGDIHEGKLTNGVPGFTVTSGNVELTLALNRNLLDGDPDGWELSNDNAQSVAGVAMGGRVGTVALVLQSSIDHEIWTDDFVATDVLYKEDSASRIIYTTKDVQLQNGCYYRLIVAYEECRHASDSQFLMVKTQNYEFRNVAEVFEFYAISIDPAYRNSANDTPRKKLGTKTNTGLDNGYSESHAIDKDDPHYGWELGEFFVNGYTREVDGVRGASSPVFLKNVGDRVTLWFHLNQDIRKLNGNPNLTISTDGNAWDRGFEVPQTNFKRGTLIVRFTDHEGVAHDPVIYTDFLAANVSTGADTRVQLFEEGDYEVALDYEIARAGKVGPVDKTDYYNYQIRFSFSIRNGNCMVYPMDALTGAELANNAVAEDGFRLDMARSRYLTIDVTRSILSVGSDGTLTEDVRFNRPAKDGDEYLDEGIYTFTVKNLYTGESTTKKIYVGTDKYLRALAKGGLTVAELNAKIASGYSVDDDGSIVAAESAQ